MAGETLACGTGVSVVAVARVLNNYTDREDCVRILGDNLSIK